MRIFDSFATKCFTLSFCLSSFLPLTFSLNTHPKKTENWNEKAQKFALCNDFYGGNKNSESGKR